MTFDFLKSPHTYLVVATFLLAGFGSITGMVPAGWADSLAAITGILSIFVHQTK